MTGRMINPSTGKGRVSLVTGSASPRGIGRAMINVFAREGAKVIISDISAREKDGLEGVKEINEKYGADTAMWVPLDVTKAEEWEKAIATIEAKFGPLDVLCNNAGISGDISKDGIPPLDQSDMAEFEKIMDINSTGVMMGCKYGAVSMKKNNVAEWKSIINTSSVAGMQGGGGVPPGYTASKWAVRGLTKAAAALGASLKIRCNSIHPGLIKSDMTAGAHWVNQETLEPTELGGVLEQRAAMGRFGEPEEVAAMVLLLASPEGSYLNGQAFIIDGSLFHG